MSSQDDMIKAFVARNPGFAVMSETAEIREWIRLQEAWKTGKEVVIENDFEERLGISASHMAIIHFGMSFETDDDGNEIRTLYEAAVISLDDSLPFIGLMSQTALDDFLATELEYDSKTGFNGRDEANPPDGEICSTIRKQCNHCGFISSLVWRYGPIGVGGRNYCQNGKCRLYRKNKTKITTNVGIQAGKCATPTIFTISKQSSRVPDNDQTEDETYEGGDETYESGEETQAHETADEAHWNERDSEI